VDIIYVDATTLVRMIRELLVKYIGPDDAVIALEHDSSDRIISSMMRTAVFQITHYSRDLPLTSESLVLSYILEGVHQDSVEFQRDGFSDLYTYTAQAISACSSLTEEIFDVLKVVDPTRTLYMLEQLDRHAWKLYFI
jgi:hypothetical protein